MLRSIHRAVELIINVFGTTDFHPAGPASRDRHLPGKARIRARRGI